MNNVSVDYGNWLGTYDWSHIATIRPAYKLTESYSERIFNTILTRGNINRVFYSTEYDRGDNFYHMHLLFSAYQNHLTRSDVANMIGMKNHPKFISYLENVKDNKAVAHYCSKYIGKKQLCYNFNFK